MLKVNKLFLLGIFISFNAHANELMPSQILETVNAALKSQNFITVNAFIKRGSIKPDFKTAEGYTLLNLACGAQPKEYQKTPCYYPALLTAIMDKTKDNRSKEQYEDIHTRLFSMVMSYKNLKKDQRHNRRLCMKILARNANHNNPLVQAAREQAEKSEFRSLKKIAKHIPVVESTKTFRFTDHATYTRSKPTN